MLSGNSNPSLFSHCAMAPMSPAAGTAVTTDPITADSTTTGHATDSFQAPEIPAEHGLWLEITAVSGSPQALTAAVLFH
ncbi:MAG: hypothetical protein KFB97_02975 [Cyanobium sp. M30B3]|nr:MAG: hypothetical protein KFB97_02975 [Cyanobium sp. M30B3]